MLPQTIKELKNALKNDTFKMPKDEKVSTKIKELIHEYDLVDEFGDDVWGRIYDAAQGLAWNSAYQTCAITKLTDIIQQLIITYVSNTRHACDSKLLDIYRTNNMTDIEEQLKNFVKTLKEKYSESEVKEALASLS